MNPLPQSGSKFVGNRKNNDGIGVQWFIKDDKSIYGEVTLSNRQEGPPLHVHGGASAAMLDEAMETAAWSADSFLYVPCLFPMCKLYLSWTS